MHNQLQINRKKGEINSKVNEEEDDEPVSIERDCYAF